MKKINSSGETLYVELKNGTFIAVGKLPKARRSPHVSSASEFSEKDKQPEASRTHKESSYSDIQKIDTDKKGKQAEASHIKPKATSHTDFQKIVADKKSKQPMESPTRASSESDDAREPEIWHVLRCPCPRCFIKSESCE